MTKLFSSLHFRLLSSQAFTLIETLVVMVIIAILIAIAAPSFLGQTQKAQDSAAKEYLSVAYRAAAASTSLNDNQYKSPEIVAQAIRDAEPELTVIHGSCPSSVTQNPQYIVVDENYTHDGDLKLCNSPRQIVWVLTVTNNGPPLLSQMSQGAPSAPPASVGSPSIIGVPQIGQTLVAQPGDWTNYPTSYAYQWQRSDNISTWVNINGANSSSYVVQSGDLNQYLRVSVTAVNILGSNSASSGPTSQVLPSVPAIQSPPSISGQAQVGQTLNSSDGVWTNSPTSYTYQWQNSPDGSNWNNIPLASSSSYFIAPEDLNLYLRIVVTAQNTNGSAAQSSLRTEAVLPTSPSNTSSPTISGSAQVGQTLTASPGAWTNSPTSYAYQWQRSSDGSSWSSISSATTEAYLVQAADQNNYLRVSVQATNSGGSTSATSIASQRVLPNVPTNTSLPQITGTPQVGETIIASHGSWDNSPTSYSYQWQNSSDGSSWDNISSATNNAYVIQSGDFNLYLRISVQATNPGGSGSASSIQTSIISPSAPTNTSLPSISGTVQVGQTLSATHGGWNSQTALSYVYQWQNSSDGSDWSNISNGTNSSYQVSAGDLNGFLRVIVQATNSGGMSSVASEATTTVLPAVPTNNTVPSISGLAQVGQTLTATHGAWTNSPTSYAYQWQHSPDGSSWSNVASGGTSNTYAVDGLDLNLYLRISVQATNPGGSGSATSNATANQVVPIAPANTSSPSISGLTQVGQTLTASHGAWTNSPTSYAYQWQHSPNGSSWSNILLATSDTYVVDGAYQGDYLRISVQATNPGGSGSATSAPTSQILPSAPVVLEGAGPVISGSAQVGYTLTAIPGTWNGNPSFSYQWQHSSDGSSWANVSSGGTNNTYLVDVSDLTLYLHVVVQAHNTGGTTSASSGSTERVLPAAPTLQSGGSPVLSDANNLLTHAQSGDHLSVTTGN